MRDKELLNKVKAAVAEGNKTYEAKKAAKAAKRKKRERAKETQKQIEAREFLKNLPHRFREAAKEGRNYITLIGIGQQHKWAAAERAGFIVSSKEEKYYYDWETIYYIYAP